jgi:hypothetical protein
MRFLVILGVLIMASCWVGTMLAGDDLAFGQVYGSAGFVNPEPSGIMRDGGKVVLAFTASDGHRSLILTLENGDFLGLLEPGKYCLAAYSRSGKAISLAKNQLKCIAVESRKEVRLDVMLMADKAR